MSTDISTVAVQGTGTQVHVSEDTLKQVLLTGTRPSRPGPISASGTFCWRALLKIKHVPEQMLDVTMFPIMFTLMFTYLFGGALAGSTAAYLQFLLPGILIQSIVFITVYTGFGINTDISKGISDRFRSLPVWRPAPIIGALLADTVRYLIAAAVILTLGLILGYRPAGGVIGTLFGVGLTLIFCFAVSWIWTTLGLILRSPNSVMGVSMMILFPLTFASNIFVDPSTMPGWLEVFVSVNPITLLVTATRGAMDGVVTSGEVVLTLVASLALVVVFAPLTMFIYRRKK